MNSIFDSLLGSLRAIFRRPLLIVLLAVIIITALILTRRELPPLDLAERVWPVNVVTVALSNEQPTLELFGEITAGRRSEMRALVPGIIVAVGPGYREGALVSAGDLLVQIDPFEYRNVVAEQQAVLNEAGANLKVKQRDLARIKELHAKKNISDQALDDGQLAVEQQKSLLEQSRIGLLRAERALEEARLVAPYTGVVSEVSVDLGKRLSVNDKVAILIDTQRLEVQFTLTNSQFGRIIESGEAIPGRNVEVNWQVGNETLQYSAVVERVGAEIDSSTGGVVLYASIAPDTLTMLRPGAFVWIRMADKHYKQVYRLPDSALYGTNSVYVVRNERLEARTIQLVGYAGDDMLFRSTEVNEGDQVVITQIREGGEGIKVEIR